MVERRGERVTALPPSLSTNTEYYVQPAGAADAALYVTGNDGVAKRVVGPPISSDDPGLNTAIASSIGVVANDIGGYSIPATFRTIGTAEAGDGGEGAIYVPGTSAGINARQDSKGRWYELSHYQRMRPEFFGSLDTPASTTAAFAAAFAAASLIYEGAGGDVFAEAPNGYDLLNLNLPNSMRLHGRGSTPLRCHATTGVMLKLVGDDAGVTGFDMQRVSTIGTVTAVQLGAGEQGQRQSVQGNTIIDFDMGVDVQSGVGWAITRNNFRACKVYGAQIRNITNADSGDGTIDDNIFSNTFAEGGLAAIRYRSAGGLKLTKNKVLGFDYALDGEIEDGASTVDLLMQTNSFENQHVACMKTGHAGSGSFSTITIVGNEFAGAPIGYDAQAGSSNITYTANAQNLLPTACVRIADGVEPFVHDSSNVRTACGPPIIDNRTGFGAARLDHIYACTIMNASQTAWQNLARIELTDGRGAQVNVLFEGVVETVSGGVTTTSTYSLSQSFLLNREGTTVVRNAEPAPSYGANFDFNLDITSVPGSAVVMVKRKTGVGTTLRGTAEIRCAGKITALHPL